MNFKEWLAEQERQSEGLASWAGAALRGAGQVALQMAGLPGPEELGLNMAGAEDAAKSAWDTYGHHVKPLTAQEIQSLKQGCFVDKKWNPCETLCSKIRNKKACKAVGVRKVGRRWVELDPLARHR